VRDEVSTTLASEKKPAKRSSTNAAKASEDKKRKSKASHGVEKLKKVNVTDVPKISSYFTKKA
jgi:ribonuclease H2 subunit B